MVLDAAIGCVEKASAKRRAIEECVEKAKQAPKGMRASWTSAQYFDSLSLAERASEALCRHLRLTSDDELFVFFKELGTHSNDPDTVGLLLQQSGVFATMVDAMCEGLRRVEGGWPAGMERRPSKFAGRKVSELRRDNVTVAELRAEGFDARDLTDGGFTVEELKGAGFEPQQLLDAGLDLRQLREARFHAAELRQLEVGASSIKDAGYTLMEMRAAGFEDEQVRSAGFSPRVLEAEQMMEAEGLAAGELHERGFTVHELYELGFIPLAMAKAGIEPNGLSGLPFTAGVDGKCQWGHIIKVRVVDRACDVCFGNLRGHVSFGCPYCRCDFCEPCMQRKLREKGWTDDDLRGAGFG